MAYFGHQERPFKRFDLGDVLQQNVAENVVIQHDDAAPDVPAGPGRDNII